MFTKNHVLKLFSDAGLTRSAQKAKSKKNEASVIRNKEGRVKR